MIKCFRYSVNITSVAVRFHLRLLLLTPSWFRTPPTIRMEAVHVRKKGAFNNVSLCVTCPAESVLLHILLFSVLRHYGGRPLMSGRSPPGRTPSHSDATAISIPSLYTAMPVAPYPPPADEVCEAGLVVVRFYGATYAVGFRV
jgi:hypothetical protein